MPSEKKRMDQGCLRKVLVNGTKPFRYRSGVRSLLGFPENPDMRISSPQPLPPAGFRYLQDTPLGEAVPKPVSGETGFGKPAIETSQKRSPIEALDLPAQGIARHRPAFHNSAKQPPVSSAIPLERGIEAAVKPGTAEGEWSPQDQGSGHESAGSSQINIPGASEKALRFPALAPQKKEDASHVQKGAAAGQTKKGQALNAQKTSEAIFDHTTISNTPRPVSSHPPIRPLEKHVFSGAQPALAHSHTTLNPMAQQAVRKKGMETEERPVQNGPFFTFTKPSEEARPVPVYRPPQAAKAQIEQLRQSLHALKRKTASRESRPQAQASQNPPDPDLKTTASHLIPEPDPQPVVIMKAVSRQGVLPPAFWERSYLSRLFRLRRLR